MDIYFRQEGITYILKKGIPSFDVSELSVEKISHAMQEYGQQEIFYYRLDMNFSNPNPDSQLKGEGQKDFYTNYYYAHCPDGITQVEQYERVIYKNVFEGVDIEFSIQNGTLKYDMIISSPDKIQNIGFIFESGGNLNTNGNQLVLNTIVGDIVETIPSSYIYTTTGEKRDVEVNYYQDGNVIRFQCEEYGNYKLVIDPAITWTTYYDDSFWNGSNSSIDAKGNQVVIVSYGFNSLFPTLNPGGGAYFQAAVAGSGDYRILKFDSDGVRIWATYYGGTGYDHSPNVRIDNSGNIVLVGHTESTNIPVQSAGGYYDGTYNAGTYGGGTFIGKFNSSGVRTWGTHYDYVHYPRLDIDLNNTIYVLGRAQYDNPPVQFLAGAYNQATVSMNQSGSSKSQDMVILKFNSATNRIWATNLGSTCNEYPQDIFCGSDGYVNIVAYGDNYYGVGIITANPGGGAYYDNTLGIGGPGGGASDRDDALIYRFTPGGALFWGTAFSGTLNENMQQARITADASNNVYICGETRSTNLPCVNPGGGAYYDNVFTASSSGFNPFLARFSSGGVLTWSTYYGTYGLGYGMNMSSWVGINENNNLVYVATDGGGAGGTFPLQPRTGDYNAPLLVYMGVYVAEFNSNLGLAWSTYYAGTTDRNMLGDCALSSGVCGYELYMTSNWQKYNAAATDPPWEKPTPSSYQNTVHLTTGSGSGLLTRFGTSSQTVTVTGSNDVCENEAGVVYSATNISGATYTWTVPTGATIVSGQGTSSIIVNFGSSGGQVCVSVTGPCVSASPVCITVNMPSPGGPGLWTWTGGFNTNWFYGCNWDKQTVPTLDADVLIPGGTPFQPTITGATGHCRTIEIVSTNGAVLTIQQTLSGGLEVHQ